ncbi:response regulator transcription factor [Falsiroseomonas sp. CW058]|uniref:response regulator transcription factor n=1 Tax=Falsiroseomonas sp. CW058 TaxID=3388664 RepID=UPI003D323EA1
MAGGTTALLVVEDDPFQREAVCAYLSGQGFAVDGVGDGAAFRAALRSGLPDAALLDVGLPGAEDGVALARWLRAQSPTVGIIMLTAAGELVDRVAGLESGADDYITKPFEPRELLARLRAVMRRAATPAHGPAAPGPLPPGAVRIGGAVLHLKSGILVTAEGREDRLTDGEFSLLRLLVEHPGRALHRDWLLERISGEEEPEAFDRAIDLRIMRLRRKVERVPGRPMAIRTVRGVGYLFDPEAG